MKNTLENTKKWFELAVASPQNQNFVAQTGVHFEEVSEMLDQLTGNDVDTTHLLGEAREALKTLADHLKANSSKDILDVADDVEFLDSLCDQVVTATGVAHMRGYRIIAALAEVNRSNFSKFDDQGQPIFNENRKIMKGPNYTKAVLAPYVAPEDPQFYAPPR